MIRNMFTSAIETILAVSQSLLAFTLFAKCSTFRDVPAPFEPSFSFISLSKLEDHSVWRGKIHLEIKPDAPNLPFWCVNHSYPSELRPSVRTKMSSQDLADMQLIDSKI